MTHKLSESDQSIIEALKELAHQNRWYIQNRWTVEEQQADAARVADKLVAIASGETIVSAPVPDLHPGSSGTISSDEFTPPNWLVTGEHFPIVGRRFSRTEFVAYVKWVQANENYTWSPKGITMHHTGFPDLSIRPHGFNEQHMLNMRHGYINDNNWRHGPHIFTDDHGIWVFNPLSIRGVHAVSYNSTRYGIEMLGNFDTADDFSNDRGISSRSNGQFAAAVLMQHAGISRAKLNFHRHDPETSKTCPGRHIDFSDFEDAVLATADQV